MSERERVFRGRTVHLLPWNGSPNRADAALCGFSPWPFCWYGTGCQSEYEMAASLPLCRKCEARQ